VILPSTVTKLIEQKALSAIPIITLARTPLKVFLLIFYGFSVLRCIFAGPHVFAPGSKYKYSSALVSATSIHNINRHINI